jgi:hypothetical protein
LAGAGSLVFVLADRERRRSALGAEEMRLADLVRGYPNSAKVVEVFGSPTQDLPATDVEKVTRVFRSVARRVEEIRAKARGAHRLMVYGTSKWVYIFYLDERGEVLEFTCFEQ